MDTKYFDYNATTPLRTEAKEVLLKALDNHWLNPSSPYRAAASVHAHLQAAREKIADLFEVHPERVVFNSGATEGNNAVFANWRMALPKDARVAISPTEHPSVLEAAEHYFGDRVEWLRLDSNGAVDPGLLNDLLNNHPQVRAVSIMAANNETGILNEWSEIAEICTKKGIQYHCDASQWIGKLPLNNLNRCDYVTGCGHKFGGPRGVGFIILPKEKTAFHSLFGGAQEFGNRAGTEDVASIIAMVTALEASVMQTCEDRDVFITELSHRLPAIELVGASANRLWNTVMLILPDFENTRWIRALEKRGFLVSSGSACATGKEGPSPVLAAIGISADKMRRALRISSGWSTSRDDWQALAHAIEESYTAMLDESKGSIAKVISI